MVQSFQTRVNYLESNQPNLRLFHSAVWPLKAWIKCTNSENYYDDDTNICSLEMDSSPDPRYQQNPAFLTEVNLHFSNQLSIIENLN